MIGDCNNKTNFQHNLLSTCGEVSRLYRAFENNSLGNIKLLKIELFNMVQLGGFVPLLNF